MTPEPGADTDTDRPAPVVPVPVPVAVPVPCSVFAAAPPASRENSPSGSSPVFRYRAYANLRRYVSSNAAMSSDVMVNAVGLRRSMFLELGFDNLEVVDYPVCCLYLAEKLKA